jgi:hypothetical protein
MQIQNIFYTVNTLYFQHRLVIYIILTALMIALSFFCSHGVVLADGPGTGGGTCSGC